MFFDPFRSSQPSPFRMLRLVAIKIKDGRQQCRINYDDFLVFSCPVSMGTLLKIMIIPISAPGKLLILNHLLTTKMLTFLRTCVPNVRSFYVTNNCSVCRSSTFALTRNHIARIMLVVEHKKLTISGRFVFWIY